jgi:HEAT repeat protein
VPLLIVDDRYRWSGLPDIDEILTICLNRDPKVMSTDSLRRIIEAGDAGDAAQMMIDAGDIFPALIQLLTDEKWSVRLGAMVTVEYLADGAPELADSLIEPLWKDFAGHAPQVQGDVAHVLGSIGSQKAKLIIGEIVDGSFDEEVIEAAKEALD